MSDSIQCHVQTGLSHLANAVEKAVCWSRPHPTLTVGSDGGLRIPALGMDWNSLLTRRATGIDVSAEERANRLLKRMHGLDRDQRRCYWTEALALAKGGTVLSAWEASGMEGFISTDFVPSPSGTDEFWVEGLWVTSDGRRQWELPPSERSTRDDPWETLARPLREILTLLR